MKEHFERFKREFSFLRVTLGGMFGFILMGASNCTTGPGSPLRSLCKMDFDRQVCWTNQAKNEGFTFASMQRQQGDCSATNNIPCWLGIDSTDAQRVAEALNRCQNPSPLMETQKPTTEQ